MCVINIYSPFVDYATVLLILIVCAIFGFCSFLFQVLLDVVFPVIYRPRHPSTMLWMMPSEDDDGGQQKTGEDDGTN